MRINDVPGMKVSVATKPASTSRLKSAAKTKQKTWLFLALLFNKYFHISNYEEKRIYFLP